MFKKINWLDDFGIFVIRVMLGVVFVFHGCQKLFGVFDGTGLAGFAQYLEVLKLPYPAYGAVLAGAAEFVGGLALITGFGMRTMTLPMMFSMGVASWYVHAHTFSIQSDGMEYPLTLGVVLFGLACTGPGKFTLQRFWPKRTVYQERTAYQVGAGERANQQVESSDDIRRRVLSRSANETPIGEEHPQPVTRTTTAHNEPRRNNGPRPNERRRERRLSGRCRPEPPQREPRRPKA